MIYAGFWRRLFASSIDISLYMLFYYYVRSLDKITIPLELLILLTTYLVLPLFIVFLNARYGVSPGKFIARIRISTLHGDQISYKEAFLRNSVDLSFSTIFTITHIMALTTITDLESYTHLSWVNRYSFIQYIEPIWVHYLFGIQIIWCNSELLVLLLNQKKRAIHDFIAGTVVIVNKTTDKISKTNSSHSHPAKKVIFTLIYIAFSTLFIFSISDKKGFLLIKLMSKKPEIIATFKMANSDYTTKENGNIITKYHHNFSIHGIEDAELTNSRYELNFKNDILDSIHWVNIDNSSIMNDVERIYIQLDGTTKQHTQ